MAVCFHKILMTFSYSFNQMSLLPTILSIIKLWNVESESEMIDSSCDPST